LENLDTVVGINRAWETILENIKISAKESLGYHELNKHKPWFGEGCSELFDKSNQVKLQWLQDPSEINGDNLKNIRHEDSRHFWNKKREYLKDKINEHATNSTNKKAGDRWGQYPKHWILSNNDMADHLRRLHFIRAL
jgi:hypothetical protein